MGKSELFGATTTKTTKLETLQSGSYSVNNIYLPNKAAKKFFLEWCGKELTVKALNSLNDSVQPPRGQSGLYYMPSLLNDPNLFFNTSWFHDSSAKLYLWTIDSNQVKLHKSIMRRYSIKTKVMNCNNPPLLSQIYTHTYGT